MAATRQDAWTEEDDLLLAEVTLRHIREGGTQLAAFEEVGEKLNRTAAACGFRWNSLVRKKYEAAIQIAKAQRKERAAKRTAKKVDTEFSRELNGQDQPLKLTSDEESISYDDIIRFLKKQKSLTIDKTKLYKKLEEKNREIEQLKKENQELKERVQFLESDYQVVNEDYKALIQIIDRARKMAFLSNDDEGKQLFKMDANGNLERIEK